MLGFPGIFEALLLIALGSGYIVLYLAKREEKGLQFIGYMIGVIIIALSLIYLVGHILTQAYYPKARFFKGMRQQRMMPQSAVPGAPAQKP